MSKREDYKIKEDIENKNRNVESKEEGYEEPSKFSKYIEQKQENFTLNPFKLANKTGKAVIKTPGRYMSYRPNQILKTTTGVKVSNFFNKARWQEVIKTYKTTESENDFETAMEVEGISEKVLVKRYKYFQWCMLMFLISSVSMMLPFFNKLFEALDNGYGFFRIFITLYPFFVVLSVLLFFYVFFAWVSFRIRNKWLLNHSEFLKIAIKDTDQLMPFNEIEWMKENQNDDNEVSKNKKRKATAKTPEKKKKTATNKKSNKTKKTT